MDTRGRLLEYLKKESGGWVSGEALSREIGVTRSAVWKNIVRLRGDGYVIDSSPGKGYSLSRTPDMLLPNEIWEGLETEVFGRGEIVYFRETDSTNARARELADQGAPEGTLVVAESQTKGRGRKGRSWFSPPGTGIYASLILRPDLSPDEAPRITFVTAISAAEALLSLTLLDVAIKWPNDILIKEKKVAGILTEISAEMDVIDYMVVGLGMNVNNPHLPHDIAERATSVLMETGGEFQRVKILREYLRRQERYYQVLRESGFGPVLGRWKELTNTIGKRVMVEMIDRRYTGVVTGVDPDGVLILQEEGGQVRRILSGDVIFV
ncbi:MAG: biotin--[acetyl-CoA-carboxylase] ligase [Deltaproteobacteria bacterium]|nr:biotin--[acetyl-CoA-carboxylase] ligase [Deltaproteobacteria bacterium]MBW2047508.1 biotin--[acetyl-CoA-carboxylase] ligase [Deltaproteobacteria bacterium]MBW2111734.1 biotin--[acetyl-CoA-carboxylase] ligase [Deltaproteobacteria bacterium]MBW2352099.1 biotin--[acetyl-CoA-carboxylase] ligase [Deltaproteobacteria bacterium]HDZ91704.1 biotin--[acetyl-CoA-carboxylase] ligase [Deltaproteobacteria bacterium]